MQKMKIDVPEPNSETIILIGETIVYRHSMLGPDSPLNNAVIADLNSRISRAKQKHAEGAKYKKLMEDAWRDRDHFLGSDEKDVFSTLKAIANKLKEKNLNINEWGF